MNFIFDPMKGQIKNYVPKGAWQEVEELLAHDNLVVKVTEKRKTKHGDYRPLPDGQHQITINHNLNPYRFLITLIHEVAHFEAFKEYGRHIMPHGKEWKKTFKRLMLPLLNPKVFPSHLLPHLARHFKNPRASSNTDHKLYFALTEYDPPSDTFLVFQLEENTKFKAQNGKIYIKGKKRVKRFECIEISTGRLWIFDPNAAVTVMTEKNTVLT